MVKQTKKSKVDSTQTLTTAINNTFKIALKEVENSKTKFFVGDYVLARMKGYSPWPGKVKYFTKDKKRASIFFYGTQNNGSVDLNQMVKFSNGFDTIRLVHLRRLQDFEKGVKEIEREHGIPDHLSSLRETESIQWKKCRKMLKLIKLNKENVSLWEII